MVLFTFFTRAIQINLPLTIFNTPGFWIIGVITILFGAFIAGFYPAFIQSSYKPVDIINNKTTGKSKNSLLRKILVVSQFSLSVLMIASTLTVYKPD